MARSRPARTGGRCAGPGGRGKVIDMKALTMGIIGAVLCFCSIARGAEKNPDVTFHAGPNPLAKDAVTTDWPCVLGPSHNEVSAETHILGQFPSSGPKLV